MSTVKKASLQERLHQRRVRHQRRSKLYRGLFGVAGVLVTVAGLVMLVLPGPALVVVPVGLSMLALEFTWAEKLLNRVLERAERARSAGSKLSRKDKIAATILGITFVLAVSVGSYIYRNQIIDVLNR